MKIISVTRNEDYLIKVSKYELNKMSLQVGKRCEGDELEINPLYDQLIFLENHARALAQQGKDLIEYGETLKKVALNFPKKVGELK